MDIQKTNEIHRLLRKKLNGAAFRCFSENHQTNRMINFTQAITLMARRDFSNDRPCVAFDCAMHLPDEIIKQLKEKKGGRKKWQAVLFQLYSLLVEFRKEFFYIIEEELPHAVYSN